MDLKDSQESLWENLCTVCRLCCGRKCTTEPTYESNRLAISSRRITLTTESIWRSYSYTEFAYLLENLGWLRLMYFAPPKCRVRTRMGQTDVCYVQFMLNSPSIEDSPPVIASEWCWEGFLPRKMTTRRVNMWFGWGEKAGLILIRLWKLISTREWTRVCRKANTEVHCWRFVTRFCL